MGDELALNIQEESVTLYSRAMLCSSLCIIISLMNRIADPYFLKDLYNAVFIMDYGLIADGQFNYSISIACEMERKKPGTGLPYLKKVKRSIAEQKIFTSHPEKSAAFLQSRKELFFNVEVIDTVLYHHEKKDGSGFPCGIAYSAMTDMETFLNFVDHMISFDEYYFMKGDGSLVIKETFNNLLNNSKDLPVEHIIERFQSCINWCESEFDTNKESA